MTPFATIVASTFELTFRRDLRSLLDVLLHGLHGLLLWGILGLFPRPVGSYLRLPSGKDSCLQGAWVRTIRVVLQVLVKATHEMHGLYMIANGWTG